MSDTILRRAIDIDAEMILEKLTIRQFVHPHEAVERSLATMCLDLGCCPKAVDRSLQWLAQNPSQSIGRLRRTELTQLARSIHRFWGQSSEIAQSSDSAP